jgi:beta-galactosidase
VGHASTWYGKSRSGQTSRDDLGYVFVDVLDDQGRLVPDVVTKVTLDIQGATLGGLGNGNPHNVDSFQRLRRWTYLGSALAIIRTPKQSGMIKIVAVIDGYQSWV